MEKLDDQSRDKGPAQSADAPQAQEEFCVIDDEEPAIEPVDEDRFSTVHIRQIASVRRAAYRSRSHAIIGTIAGAVACPELCLAALQHLRLGGYIYASVAFLLAAASIGFAVWCARLTIRLHRAIRLQESEPEPPLSAPDFSTLSDGSQRWKDLQ